MKGYMVKKVCFGERLKKGVPPRRSFGVGESGKSGDGKEKVATRMKLLSVNTGFILFIVGLSIFACAEVWGADWRLISSTDSYKCFYDAENITRSSKNIVGVWARLEYTEKGIRGIVKEFGKHYENLSYSLELWEIDCVKKKQRILSITEYSVEGSILYTNPAKSRPSAWKSISREAVGESLYNAVCK